MAEKAAVNFLGASMGDVTQPVMRQWPAAVFGMGLRVRRFLPTPVRRALISPGSCKVYEAQRLYAIEI